MLRTPSTMEDKVTSHYLNNNVLVCWCIYAAWLNFRLTKLPWRNVLFAFHIILHNWNRYNVLLLAKLLYVVEARVIVVYVCSKYFPLVLVIHFVLTGSHDRLSRNITATLSISLTGKRIAYKYTETVISALCCLVIHLFIADFEMHYLELKYMNFN